MKIENKALLTALALALLLAPLGVVTSLPAADALISQESSVPAADYDFGNRNSPTNLLIYTQYADSASGGEYENTMAAINAEYGNINYLQMANLSNYANLSDVLDDTDVLLILEQELADAVTIAEIAATWAAYLPGWVENGGVVICMGYWEDDFALTFRILNETGLLPVYNATDTAYGSSVVVDSSSPLAFDVEGSFPSADGTVSFAVTHGNVVVESDAMASVVHRRIGLGHAVLLGYDLYDPSQAYHRILCNALKLNRILTFDMSNGGSYAPTSGYVNYSRFLCHNGFAINAMYVFSEAWIETSQILYVQTTNSDNYDASEIGIIESYVNEGGAVLLMTDWGDWGLLTDPVLTAFGYERDNRAEALADSDEYVDFEYWPYYSGAENIANHSTTRRASSIQMFAGTALTTIPDNGEAVVWTDTDGTANWSSSSDPAPGAILAACSTFGNGRVFVVTDLNMWVSMDSDGNGIENFFEFQNEYFALSSAFWLLGAGIPEKTVLVDNSNSPYMTFLGTAFDEFVWFLSANGFNVKVMNHFSQELLDQADVLIMLSGSINHTTQQIESVIQFVQRGGGLFAVGDNGFYAEEITLTTQEFGIEYNTTGGSIVESDDYDTHTEYVIFDDANFAAHPIMSGVHRMEFDKCGGIASVGSGVALVSTDDDGTATWFMGGVANEVPVLAATEFGMGRVVAITDYNLPTYSNPELDDYVTLYDSENDIFLANAFYWLVMNRAPVVELLTPNGGEVWNGTRTVEWDAADPNRDDLEFAVWYSDNNGSDWTLLDDGIISMTYDWNTTQHDDGNSYMIRVVAFDGILDSYDDSDDPFELDNFVGGGPGGPGITIDPMLLALIGGAAVVVIIVVAIIMKRPKE